MSDEALWGNPTEAVAELNHIRKALTAMEADLKHADRRLKLTRLVGSLDIAEHSVHRWYSYKEAFSPELPGLVADELGVGKTRTVLDVFAGVGTTSLALRKRGDLARVTGIEYSPFAQFVGETKIGSLSLSPRRLRRHVNRLGRFTVDESLPLPELAAFSNPEIFPPRVAAALLSARAAVETDGGLTPEERRFFLLGVAAIVEDVSGAMKDGRALRIRRGRRLKPKALSPTSGAVTGSGVREVLLNHWRAMIEDIEGVSGTAGSTLPALEHLRGDARELDAVVDADGSPLLDAGSVGLCLYSPPYLNCVDYTEVYKLELWLLGLVRTQAEFRAVRLGTLRSHGSIRFPDRDDALQGDAGELVDRIAKLLEMHLPRTGTGVMVANYFRDMRRALDEQLRVLEPGGHFACVVGNSTFSRREKTEAGYSERWRLPLLTDVLLARIARDVGFRDVRLWHARDLRPRNVANGTARESIIIGRR